MNTILVTTSRGLDELLQTEIKQLCPEVETKLSPGMVRVSGSLKDAYKLCLWSRLANRVIWLLGEGDASSSDSIYDFAKSLPWEAHFHDSNTISVQFNGTNRAINNTQFGAVRIKDAIVDYFVETNGMRPSVDKRTPDILIHCRCHRDKVAIGIDLSGGSLHQRAYRQETGDAPLKEHIACAMLMRSGWTNNTSKPLVDLMCGSGTLAIEAAYIARNIAPALKRERWGFEHWLQHDDRQWEGMVNDAIEGQHSSTAQIYASDIDRRLVAIARKNADVAGVFNDIRFDQRDATTITPPDGLREGYIVSNPPYGERLGELTELLPLFSEWGKQLKAQWKGWQLSLLSSNRELLRILKLRARKEYAMNNGKLECKFALYMLDDANCEQFSNDAEDHEFANRLKKNLKKLKPWLKKQDTDCYRIYDADLPDYNVAIDRYGDWLVVQEYAPPKTVEPEKAQRRLQDVLLYLPAVTGVPAKNITLKVRSQQKGTNQYEKIEQTGKRMQVWENGAKLLVNLTDYLDTGLFLDHRDTRLLIKQMAQQKDVLNLFSYTGSVSVSAAMGGARSVTTVDMSKTYLDWAKENFSINKLKGAYQFVQADCTTWLATHRGKYDLIFIDPPSFSNSKRMQNTWDVQRDHATMLTQAKACLKDKGTIVFSNNRRGFKLDLQALDAIGMAADDISQKTIPGDFARHSNIHKCWIIKEK